MTVSARHSAAKLQHPAITPGPAPDPAPDLGPDGP